MFTTAMQPLAILISLAHHHPMAAISELWQRLRQARRFADMTQADLAKRCGVTRGAVALWESAESEHRTKPSIDHIQVIAEACRVPLDWLLNDASDPNDVWRRAGEFGDGLPPAEPPGPGAEPSRAQIRRSAALAQAQQHPTGLVDFQYGNDLFVFAHPSQVPAKLEQLAREPATLNKHLVLIGVDVNVHLVPSAAQALPLAFQIAQRNAAAPAQED